MSKIIIVDDSEDILSVMKFFLELKGYTVKTTSNSHDLKLFLKSFSPDLIIMDIFLSGEDGRRVCEDLRSDLGNKDLCILMFSASPNALANYKDYGADGFIEKPFGLNEIVDKIEAAIKKCKDYHSQ